MTQNKKQDVAGHEPVDLTEDDAAFMDTGVLHSEREKQEEEEGD